MTDAAKNIEQPPPPPRRRPAPPTVQVVKTQDGAGPDVLLASDFAFDNHTIFLVIDEGEEDGRLMTAVLEAVPGLRDSRVVTNIPLMRLSERHSICPVFRKNQRGNKNMRKWPITVAGPFSCADFFGVAPSEQIDDDEGSVSELESIDQSKMLNTIGPKIVPATFKIEDHAKGPILRMRYA